MTAKNKSQPKTPIRIVIVDDHAVVRQGTRELLNRNPQFNVVGESESGEELVGLLQLKQPDVLLLDINLPGKNGLQLLSELRPQFPALKIILFSAHCDMQYIRRAQQLHADGFLSKTIGERELQDAILAALQNPPAPVLSADILSKLETPPDTGKESSLTAREQEILAQLAQGLTNQGIAKNLCLSVKTVDTHVANLMKKTGVNKRTQLLAYAYEHGLI
jgi:DNA-binding NarL/FixJ family response regulator